MKIPAEYFLEKRVTLYSGDCLDVMADLPANSFDSVVCDPPYGLRFMGRAWDHGVPGIPYWQQCFRLLKPGGHLIAFSGTRTYHRLATAIEDAGFDIRDMVQWLYGQGFPKSHDVSKGIDKAAGATREVVGTAKGKGGENLNKLARVGGNDSDSANGVGAYGQGAKQVTVDIPVTVPATTAAQEWEGWGTALKPACEPICMARKPLSEETVAANVLRWGTGAINVDGCRVQFEDTPNPATNPMFRKQGGYKLHTGDDSNSTSWKIKSDRREQPAHSQGRWPANIIHDGSDEVIAAFPETSSGEFLPHHRAKGTSQIGTFDIRDRSGEVHPTYGDEGSAARFFYTAKADSDDRLGSKHPTVKPVDLKQWLCRLVTPKSGIILDPFAGTGTTGEAALREGFNAILIEKEPEYQTDIRRRMALCTAGPAERKRESIKALGRVIDDGPLFGGMQPKVPT